MLAALFEYTELNEWAMAVCEADHNVGGGMSEKEKYLSSVIMRATANINSVEREKQPEIKRQKNTEKSPSFWLWFALLPI